MRLTKNFTKEELEFSETASRLGINNTIPPELMDNAKKLALGLQNVRELLGTPIFISSGYRCLELNNILKSKPTSAHVRCLAADIRSDRYSHPNGVIFAIINSDIPYDQIILEHWNADNPYSGWVHISFAENGETPRQQALIIDQNGTSLYNK